jgi:hypothetical protein
VHASLYFRLTIDPSADGVSCSIPEIHEAVVAHADELILRYSTEVLNYLESAKLSSAVRLKHVVGILTNVAYIQDDCAARSTLILQEFLPKAALQNRELEAQVSRPWQISRGKEMILDPSLLLHLV